MTQPIDSALDFERIVFGFDREIATIEYKGAFGWDEIGREAQRELVRDLIAFGNSDAIGYIAIGVSKTESGGFDRVGLTTEQAGSYDPSPIGVIVRQFADPEVRFTIHTPTLQGKNFVILRVVPFETVPHICKTSYASVLEQAAIYVRTDNAESVKVPTAEHMRRLVERATFNQRDRLLAQIRELVGPGTGPTQPPTSTQSFRDQIARRFGR